MRVLLVPAASIAERLDTVVARLRDAGLDVMVATPDILETTQVAEFDLIAGPGQMRIDGALMDRCPRLGALISVGVGCEGFHSDAARARSIAIATGRTDQAVAGMASAAIMMMLALAHDLPGAMAAFRTGDRRDTARTRTLDGATVGIVGYGGVGREVARRLRLWGVRVVASSPSLGVGAIADGVEGVPLECLLEISDFVSLHAALTPQTRLLLDHRRLSLMKPRAFLVNTARGALVDEAALARALRTGRIAGAALDCFTEEPLPSSSPLRNAPNTILTPHQIGHTAAGMEALVETFIENIARLAEVVQLRRAAVTGAAAANQGAFQ